MAALSASSSCARCSSPNKASRRSIFPMCHHAYQIICQNDLGGRDQPGVLQLLGQCVQPVVIGKGSQIRENVEYPIILHL